MHLQMPSEKDLLGGKSSRKENLVRNLLLLVVLGLCGISMGLITVDKRYLLWKLSLNITHYTRLKEEACHKKLQLEDFRQHYPSPKLHERGGCACAPVHYFVILSMQRSGSGWFETLLNNHPNISSHGEIFSVKQRRKNFSTIVETLDSVYNLDWLSSAAKNECTSAVGLKWMLNQGVLEYNREVSEYFQKKGVSVIFLLRRNLLRRLVSVLANAYDREMKLLNGTHKSHVHSREEADALAAYKPTLNVTFLYANLQRAAEVTQDAILFFNNTRHAIFYYEDLVKDKKKIVEVQQFLGVPVLTLQSRQVKIHTKPLSSQIQNWNAVYNSLKGTLFEPFLDSRDYE